MTTEGMTNVIWERAAALADGLRDEGFNPVDCVTVTTLALAMQVTFHKRDERSMVDVEETAVRTLRKVLGIMHQAREASLPGR